MQKKQREKNWTKDKTEPQHVRTFPLFQYHNAVKSNHILPPDVLEPGFH